MLPVALAPVREECAPGYFNFACRGKRRAISRSAIAGDPNIADELLKGKTIGDRTYRNHLDGYDQSAAITGTGPSARHEIFYFGESTLGAVRINDYKYRFIDQPEGWLGEKTHPDMPILTNLRLDPFERTGWPGDGVTKGSVRRRTLRAARRLRASCRVP